MNIQPIILALSLALAGCGDGNPFEEPAPVDPAEPGTGSSRIEIPESLASDLEGFNYKAGRERLVIRGVSSEDSPYSGSYRRRENMDRVGYSAYTQQDGSLDRHSTAYVRKLRNAEAVVVTTGGQFEEFFGGTGYKSANYTPPVAQGGNRRGGLISYAGRYVGLLNAEGSREDLKPVRQGTPGSFRPSQATEITGRVLLTGSFSDRAVDGVVTNRRLNDFEDDRGRKVRIRDLALGLSPIEDNGSFTGSVTQNRQSKGTYGGVFAGKGASEVAGSVHVTNHIDGASDPEEFGIFVLGACGKKGQDRACRQPDR
ncbi:thymidylate synthase [Sulfitobacter sp. LCG007]